MNAKGPIDGGRVGYDVNPEFNQYLDDANDVVEVEGLRYAPSEVLYATDYGAYLDCLVDYESTRREQLAQSVVESFPTPVALTFRRSQKGAQNANQKVLYLRDTWEALINTLFALAMGELRVRKVAGPIRLGNRAPARRDLLTDRLSTRLDLLEAVLEVAGRSEDAWGLTTVVTGHCVGQLRELNRLRNKVSHASTMSETQAEAFYYEKVDSVLAALREAGGLESARIIRCLGSRQTLATISCEVFAGFQGERTIEDLEFQPDALASLARHTARPSVLMLVNDCVVSLAPFIHFRETPDGSRTELCFLKRGRAGTLEYEAVGYSATSEYGRLTLDEAVFADDIAALVSALSGVSVPGRERSLA